MSNVLEVRDLAVEFKTEIGITHALSNVNFNAPKSEITAIVGESGSGKSVTANCIMRLVLPPGKISGGSILFRPSQGESFDILQLDEKDPRIHELRGGNISMVFQEPMTALSPVHRVGDQVSEAILCHRKVSKKEAWEEAAEMLDHVGIEDVSRRIRMYPFEFSGGMRQRVVIAMALVCHPDVLICDEPTTALDVTIQAEILTLIRQLHEELENSVLFITHDLGVVAQLADSVVVMYQGRVVEIGTVRQVLTDPVHPYTRGLLAANPGLGSRDRRLATIQSEVGDADITTPYPLRELDDGRMVSLPPSE